MEALNREVLEKLGKLTRQIRKEVSSMPKVGMNIEEIINFVEDTIFENGYLPAFPCGVSVNEIAAHFTVFDEEVFLKKGDVIKIDFGVSENGFVTDNAVCVEVEDNKFEKQMKTNLEALNNAMNKIEIGTTMGEIGKIVEDTAQKSGFNTIHNLSGHQISRNNIHCGLHVPNYDNQCTKSVTENCELAIEPFFTTGNPKIKASGNSHHLHLMKNKPVRDPIAKKLLKYIIANFPHLPFSKRWLLKDIKKKIPNCTLPIGFDKKRVLYGLNILKKEGIIYEYEALASVDGAIVTQYEDTVLFHDKKKTIITRL